MKFFLIMAALFLSIGSAHGADYGDRDCNVYISWAGNVVTGGWGNFISATVVVSKDLIERDFREYEVKIQGYEKVKPTRVEDAGRALVFTFDKYRPGIEYRSNSATVVAYITNGIDNLFDNNGSAWLVADRNWQYHNRHCRLN